VKETLVVDIGKADEAMAIKYKVELGCEVILYDFVLVSEEETRKLREEKAKEAMAAQGRRMKLLEGLPIPDLD
jgi:hypothetical protein